jgi:para-nitrobenzyl esterase
MKKLIGYLAFVIILSMLLMSASIAQGPVVKTTNGLVQGYMSGDLKIFKGIPFAAPPVGELRWKAPQPVKNWQGVLKCEKFSASPVQSDPKPFMMWTEEFITPPGNLSEDCLYLNVWTPSKTGKEKLPVFVYIYGGGFSSGSAACAVYDGEDMAKNGIVFVSINYRVGIFGFLAHPALTAESPNKASGNYGLLDQVAALTWIKNNIEAFGGDPGKVTIAGQSAGSMSVCSLVSSQLTKGLFRGAIAQSGGILSGFMLTGLADAEKAGTAVQQNLKATDIAAMRKMSAQDLLKVSGRFSPVLDGYVLPVNIFEAYKAGKFNNVNMMAGWVTGDGILMGQPKTDPDTYAKTAKERYGENADQFLKVFPGKTAEEASSSSLLLNLMQFAAMPAYLWSGFNKGKSYIYEFSHVPVDKPNFPNYGAFHTSEVPFALHTLHMWKRPWRDIDNRVESVMSSYWVNFVKNGDPNGKGLPEWKVYEGKTGNIMEIGDQQENKPDLYKDQFGFLAKTMKVAK